MSQFKKIENYIASSSTMDRAIILTTLLAAGFTILDPVFYHLGNFINPEVKEFSRTISHLGRGGVVLIPSAILLILATIAASKTEQIKHRAALHHLANIFTFIFASVATAGITALLLKNIIGRARPKHFDLVGSFHFSPLTFDSSFASFPSGHATTSFAFAAALCFLMPKYKYTALSIAFWITLSRFLIGAHYLTDIMIGSLLGIITVIYSRRYFASKNILFKTRQNGKIHLQGGRILKWYWHQIIKPKLNNLFITKPSNINFKPAMVILKKIKL